jgi:hypothetical protein
MSGYCASVLLAWSIAAAEAHAANAAEIEPAHLLLGICKRATSTRTRPEVGDGGLTRRRRRI